MEMGRRYRVARRIWSGRLPPSPRRPRCQCSLSPQDPCPTLQAASMAPCMVFSTTMMSAVAIEAWPRLGAFLLASEQAACVSHHVAGKFSLYTAIW